MGCNYLSLPFIPTSDTQVLLWSCVLVRWYIHYVDNEADRYEDCWHIHCVLSLKKLENFQLLQLLIGTKNFEGGIHKEALHWLQKKPIFFFKFSFSVTDFVLVFIDQINGLMQDCSNITFPTAWKRYPDLCYGQVQMGTGQLVWGACLSSSRLCLYKQQW